MKRMLLCYLWLFLPVTLSYAGEISSLLQRSLRGRVIDSDTRCAVVGALILSPDDAFSPCYSDSSGCFCLHLLPGSYRLEVRSMAHLPCLEACVMNAAEDQSIVVLLEPRSYALSSVDVTSAFRKERPINPLLYSSARSFSTEEAYRYAGSLGDVARMARSYAGVASLDDRRNDLVVRGNSPTTLLWRLDGFELPNPNHFASIGLTGSTVSMLNPNLIANSDFILGASPAEYGNALSGVFDLKLRRLEGQRRRCWFATGWNGFELGAETPFQLAGRSAECMICYRYSFLDGLSKLGLATGVVPKYQDLSVVATLPLNETSSLGVLGLWGMSGIDLGTSSNEQGSEQTSTGSASCFLGLKWTHEYESLHTEVRASADQIGQQSLVTLTRPDAPSPKELYRDCSEEWRYVLAVSTIYRPANAAYRLGAGAFAEAYDMHFFQANTWYTPLPDTLMSVDETMFLWRGYLQAEYFVSDHFKCYVGCHGQYLGLNHRYSIEPRLSCQWRFNQRHRLALSAGRHSQLQPHTLYFYGQTEGVPANRQLDFSRSHQLTLTHDWQCLDQARVKTDLYYQYIGHIPIKDDASSPFSMVNLGSDFFLPLEADLTSRGKATNYGLESTFEKFWSDGWFLLCNASCYRSRYQGGDQVWRSSNYDLRCLWNLSGGYALTLGKMVLETTIKSSWTGGRPFTPVDELASQAAGYVVYDYERYHACREAPYFRCDLRLCMKVNLLKQYYEFAIDFQNLTNHHNVLYRTYVPSKGSYELYYQTLFAPMYTFKWLF